MTQNSPVPLYPCIGQGKCRSLRTKSWTVFMTCPSRATFTDRPEFGIVYRLTKSKFLLQTSLQKGCSNGEQVLSAF